MFGEREHRRGLAEFGDLFMPDEAAEPILGGSVRAALMEWLEEIWAEPELEAVGIQARKRALFDGPPGVGKTTLAHHLAARLGLPMLAVRPDRILSRYVNQSTEQIGQLFEAVCGGFDGGATPIVLFLDEFDALAPERQAPTQAADRQTNQQVNTLLQRIEQHRGFLIAATNHGSQLDPAIWRRFDMHITLDMPGLDERERILARYLAPYGLPGRQLRKLAEACDLASPALMRQLCENLKRQLVLGPKLKSDMSREAVFARVLAACHPHPTLGKPRLWTRGAADHAVSAMAWPLPMADALPADEEVPPSSPETVVRFPGAR